MDDLELLQAYADRQDQQAFAQMVSRHGGWLYSAARRQLADGHLAEDVTQAVFWLLSRRAKALRNHTALSVWLFVTLGYCIKEMKRHRARIQRREQEAASMQPSNIPDATWEDIAPLLETLVARLGKADQHAVLLRFYEQKPLAEVGRLMGTSEEAARKRVDRAVEKLRGMLQKQGVTGTSAGLSAVLVGNVVREVPARVVEGVMKVIAGGSVAAGAIAPGAMKMMALAKVKAAILFVALASGALIAGVWVMIGNASATPVAATLPTAPATVVPAASAPAASAEIVRTRRLLFELRTRPLISAAEQWTASLRELVNSGPPAVPEIIAELDRAPNDSQVRAMAFALRVIGDRRAIPALLRALPRTAENTSDFGLAVDDRDLWQFMHANEIVPSREGYPHFDYNRAVRLVNAALEKLTGHSVGEKAFFTPEAKRTAVSRWQEWWAASRAKYPEALAYEQAWQGPDYVAAAGKGLLFPTGESAHLGAVIERELQSQGPMDQVCCCDLDTGRTLETLEGFAPRTKQEQDEAWLRWMPMTGVDCHVIEVFYEKPGRAGGAGGEKEQIRCLLLYGDGTRTWKVDDALWERIDAVVKEDKLELRERVRGDFCMPEAGAEKAGMVPLTYLFITREGARGILQVTSSSAQEGKLRFRYRLWEGTGAPSTRPAANAPSFAGAQFGPEKQVQLAGPSGGLNAGFSLSKETLLPLPEEAELPPYGGDWKDHKAAFDVLWGWMKSNGVDWVTDRDVHDALCGVRVRQATVAGVSNRAWDAITAEHAAVLVHRSIPREESYMNGWKIPSTYVVETNDGAMAMVQVAAMSKNPELLTLRYRRIVTKATDDRGR